jgi:DNA ligase (NAD+)
LPTLEGIGTKNAASIYDWFHRPQNQALIDKLKRAGVITQTQTPTQAESIEQSLRNLTFVITGTLPTLSRDDAKELIQKHGGKVTDSVSTKTNYLLLGENPGSKFDKAKQLGVPILSEDQLKELLQKTT